jgi:thymidylate synthase ThyX
MVLPPVTEDATPENSIDVLDHGFVRLDGALADDLSVANAARVSFARRKEELDESDEGLIRFLMRDRHGTPFEHNAFRFHVQCPIFVAREWFRHRIGCLTGDTEVTFVDSNGHVHMRKTIEELWTMWHVGEHDVRGLRVRTLDEETNEFGISGICDVLDKGVQPVYRLTLADGKAISLTENHRLLTDSGWKRMRDAVGLEGDGETASTTNPCRLTVNGVPSVIREIEAPVRKGDRLSGHSVEVVGVEYIGLRQTYDLSIEGPWHNFVANGIVVHNSFNEFSMRYAKATDEFYVPSPGDVRSQVGKPGAYTFEPVDPALAERARDEIQAVYTEAFGAYERLVEAGVARELARAVMPVGAYTQFYWTVNARALMNFVSLRAAETAQLEIRRYADAVEYFFAERMPVTHAAFVANARTAP